MEEERKNALEMGKEAKEENEEGPEEKGRRTLVRSERTYAYCRVGPGWKRKARHRILLHERKHGLPNRYSENKHGIGRATA
jgi:hypothetical protein